MTVPIPSAQDLQAQRAEAESHREKQLAIAKQLLQCLGRVDRELLQDGLEESLATNLNYRLNQLTEQAYLLCTRGLMLSDLDLCIIQNVDGDAWRIAHRRKTPRYSRG